jgi:hypothetical protein
LVEVRLQRGVLGTLLLEVPFGFSASFLSDLLVCFLLGGEPEPGYREHDRYG